MQYHLQFSCAYLLSYSTIVNCGDVIVCNIIPLCVVLFSWNLEILTCIILYYWLPDTASHGLCT